jgi:2'-5' RNA ligase
VRLFVAVYPPPAAVADLAEFTARLHVVRAGARVAVAATWHVTLAFLGEVPDERLPRVVAAVSLAAGTRPGPMRLRVGGGGTFGRGRSTVLWVGVGPAVPELAELAGAVRRALGRARLPYDRKPLRPHLTLARPGGRVPADLVGEDVAALDGYRGPEWTVERVLLMSSQPGPTPTYDVVHAEALSTGDSAG